MDVEVERNNQRISDLASSARELEPASIPTASLKKNYCWEVKVLVVVAKRGRARNPEILELREAWLGEADEARG